MIETEITMDLTLEKEDCGFVKTLNNMGYMCGELDYFSQKFVNFSKNNSPVLDVGAAYGIASLAALRGGAVVYSNDIEEKHLKILYNRCDVKARKNLFLCKGSFPEEIDFADETFAAILISRVLHFFDGEKIRKSLKKCKQWLKPKGKMFLISDTPYMKNWDRFLPIYKQRKAKRKEWPGFLANSKTYATKRAEDRQEKVNFLDPEIFIRELEGAGFYVEETKFIDRLDFPEDMRGLGKESAGAIAIKD
jgi:SAM-dependent methyltransferase